MIASTQSLLSCLMTSKLSLARSLRKPLSRYLGSGLIRTTASLGRGSVPVATHCGAVTSSLLPSVRPWLVTDLHGKQFTYDGDTRTIAFNLGTPPPQPTTFIVPRWTANGDELSDYYTLRINVDTTTVDTAVLPIGRSEITADDLGSHRRERTQRHRHAPTRRR